jgi:transcriptional regulator with XRE-family HTH domain
VDRYDPDTLVHDIGRRVAELRRERGLTQQALATKLRATMQWVQQIEYGTNLTVYSLARVANALDAPLEAFLVPPQVTNYVRHPGRPPKMQPLGPKAAENPRAPKARSAKGKARRPR